MRSPYRLALALLSTLLAAACGDLTGLGASGPVLGGVWVYSASNLKSSQLPGAVCSVSDVRITVSQTGNTFTGSTTGGVFRCTGHAELAEVPLAGLSVTQGTVYAGSVRFNFNNPDWSHNGIVRYDREAYGSVQLLFGQGGKRYRFNGGWTANKR